MAGWADRLPRHTWALGICALALLLGIAVVDDYGVSTDTDQQREIGEATLRHLAGESGEAGERGAFDLLRPPWNKLYGAAFEAPLALVERILDRDDYYSIYIARHLLTHLFFIVSAFAGYLLAHRMFGSRWLALFALALFLLHPRVYAHSFFNSKDVPFLAMFMICLWLAHRAFLPRPRADIDGTAVHGAFAVYGAFALCGIAAGLLTNLRVSGLVFVAVVILTRLCDVALAGGWGERRRALASCALFAFTSVAAYYATMPYLWADPLERFGELVTTMLAHPDGTQSYKGETTSSSELPLSYLPASFSVTTPPLALALGAVGLAALVWRCGAAGGGFRPTNAALTSLTRLAVRMATLLRNAPLRFELLVGACFVLPVLAVVVLQPPLYNGWRHFYFLWAPFVLLAASGLRTLADGASAACRRFLPEQAPAATVVAGLAALGLGAIVVESIRMHPDQDRYLNVLATGLHAMLLETTRPRGFTYVLEELAGRDGPDAVFNVKGVRTKPVGAGPLGITRSTRFGLLSQRDQRRFKFDPNADVDFFFVNATHFRGLTPLVTPPPSLRATVPRQADHSGGNTGPVPRTQDHRRCLSGALPGRHCRRAGVQRRDRRVSWRDGGDVGEGSLPGG